MSLDETATGGGGTSLTISNAAAILDDVHLGDSIAVNGTCLTVTEFTADTFKVGVAPETLRRTNLGALAVGQGVDLERAVAGSVRFGGHFVQVWHPRGREGERRLTARRAMLTRPRRSSPRRRTATRSRSASVPRTRR